MIMKTIVLLKKLKNYMEENGKGVDEPKLYGQLLEHIDDFKEGTYRDGMSEGIRMGKKDGKKETQEKIIEALGLDDFVQNIVDRNKY